MSKETLDAVGSASSALGMDSSLRETPLVTESTSTLIATFVVFAAITYMAGLCFVHTHLHSMSRGLVGAAEFAILLACLPVLLNRLPPRLMVLMTFTGATLCVLSLIHGRVDLKNIRDLLIPLWFFWLGCNIGSTAMADGLVKRILVLVIAFAFFELFFLDAYTRVFNIYSYYIAIGNLQPVTDYVRESRLQLNGFRPEGIGRTLLPSLLDKHRISSVFIDPVSLGNFASIVAAWGLSKDRAEWKTGGLFLLAAVLLMVLADSRFALVCVMLMVIIRMGLRGRAHTIIMILPLLVVGILVVLGVGVAGPLNDDYFGRLVRSGQALVGFDTGTLLGVSSGVSFADHGYAYVFSHFGILLSLALWLAIWGLRIPDERSQRLRAFLALYVALLLCVSGTSVFALKTAGVLWFLFGCSLNAGSAAVVRS